MKIEIPAQVFDYDNQKPEKIDYVFTNKDIRCIRLLRTLINKGIKLIDSEKYPNLSEWLPMQENDFIIALLKKFNELYKTA